MIEYLKEGFWFTMGVALAVVAITMIFYSIVLLIALLNKRKVYKMKGE